MKNSTIKLLLAGIGMMMLTGAVFFIGCKGKSQASGTDKDAASKVYVSPGKHDEFYNFVSGGFSGQMAVYGLPSGRLFRVIPVFSVDPTSGYGYSEETKAMLNTSHGFVPWDDLHHPALSLTNGEHDGR
ncbi:MAG: nitrous oxide reductase, partial [Bacteroidia bacterium]